jgi:hypothetical protein
MIQEGLVTEACVCIHMSHNPCQRIGCKGVADCRYNAVCTCEVRVVRVRYERFRAVPAWRRLSRGTNAPRTRACTLATEALIHKLYRLAHRQISYQAKG